MTEIATAYISVVPEVNKAIQAAYAETAKGGRQLGEALGGGLSSGAGSGLDALKAKVQATAGAVQKSTRDMAAAQKAEADATGALRVAAEKLNEVRDNAKAKTSQLVAAEEALAKAQRSAEVASKKTADAVSYHESALTRAKTATDGFSTAQASVSTSTTKTHGAVTKLNAGMDKMAAKTSEVGRGMAGMLAGFGALAAGAAISSGIGNAIKAASDLSETVNKSNVIFKGNAAAMETWASGAAKSFGLSKKAALESAAGFGNMFAQLGFSADAAAAMSRQVVQMSADLGSFNNLPTGEVTEMISAAFRGEYDSLQRLIPNISAARVEQEALAATHKKSAKDLTASEKASAVLAIVQKDGAAAAGDFAKTSDGLANSQKIAAASAEDLSAKFGEKLQPAMQAVQQVGLKILEWVSENTPLVTAFAVAVGILAAVMVVWTAVQWALNSAMLANSMFWVVAAIVALIAAVIWAWNNFETFRNIVTGAWTAIKTVVGVVVSWFTDTVVPAMVTVWENIQNAVASVVEWFQTYVQPTLEFVWALIKFGVEFLVASFRIGWELIRRLVELVVGWFQNTAAPFLAAVWNTIMRALQPLIDFFKAAFGAIQSAAQAVADWLMRTLAPAFQAAWDVIKNAFNTTVTAIGGIWDRLKELAKVPVRFIIDTIINDGLVNGINTVAGWLGLQDSVHVNRVPLPPGFGGGGWTGPGGMWDPAGVVHADEFVVKKKSRRSIEGAMPGFLDALNRFGASALGYAAGGRVRPVPGGWTTYSGHTGVDFPVGTGTPVHAFLDGIVGAVRAMATSYGNHVVIDHASGLQSIYGHLERTLVSVGQTVSAGDQVGLSDSTGNSTGPHLHFELRQNGQWFDPSAMLNGAEAPSGGGGVLSFLKDRVVNFFRDNINGLLDRIPGGGPFRDVMVGGSKKIVNAVADWLIGKADAKDTVSGTFDAGAGASQWAGVALQALKMAGQPDSLLPLLLHRIQVESAGNPNAINNWDSNAAAGHPSQGLMQTIPSTFAAYAGALAGRGINDPLANIFAAIMYTNDRYRGNFGRAWSGTAGYAEGGLVEPLLLDAGGIIPKGVSFVENRTGSPEALYRGGGMPSTVILQVGDQQFTGYLREEIGRPAQMAAAGRRTV